MVRLAKGILVAVEGVDGSGKTTQTAAVASCLSSLGLDVVASKEPTNGIWGQKIRRTATEGRLPAEDELELFFADRREHVQTLIRPGLESGKVVIVDRYYYSSAAYQGTRGLDWRKIVSDNEKFAPRPDVLVILEVPVDVGLARIRLRGDDANLFEQRAALEACAEIFSAVAGVHILRVDGQAPKEVVTDQILRRIYHGPLFERLCGKGYKPACEPEYCVLNAACDFLKMGSLAPVHDPSWFDEAEAIAHNDSIKPQDKIDRLLRIARR